MKILIDNGHGENTPGKRSPDGSLRVYRTFDFFICLIFIKNSFGDYFISSVLLMVLLSVPLVTDIFLIIICL